VLEFSTAKLLAMCQVVASVPLARLTRAGWSRPGRTSRASEPALAIDQGVASPAALERWRDAVRRAGRAG